MKFTEITFGQFCSTDRSKSPIVKGDDVDTAIRKKFFNGANWEVYGADSTNNYKGYGNAGKTRLITVYNEGCVIVNITGKGDKTHKHYKIEN
jgi:hypothetical protein